MIDVLIGFLAGRQLRKEREKRDANIEAIRREAEELRQRITEPREDRYPCPFCAELIKENALVCRYCGRELPREEPVASAQYVLSDGPPAEAVANDVEVRTGPRWNAPGILLLGFVVLVGVAIVLSRQSATRMPMSNAAPVLREATFVVVTVASARIRENPSLDAPVAATATETQRFSVRSKRDGWYEVAAPERPGVTIGFIHESVVRTGDR